MSLWLTKGMNYRLYFKFCLGLGTFPAVAANDFPIILAHFHLGAYWIVVFSTIKSNDSSEWSLEVVRILLLSSFYIFLFKFSWIFYLFRLPFMRGDWGTNHLLEWNSCVWSLNQEMSAVLETDSLLIAFMITCLMCSCNFLDIIGNFIYSITALNLFSRK